MDSETFFHSVNVGGKTRNVRTCSFFSAAEPSDLGALGVLLLLVVVGGGPLLVTHVQFLEVCSKVAHIFYIISKPK